LSKIILNNSGVLVTSPNTVQGVDARVRLHFCVFGGGCCIVLCYNLQKK
jgi:hypothetical protein